jgi:hypothetical protein
MATMKTASRAPGNPGNKAEMVDAERPVPGPKDAPELAEHQDRFARLISHQVPSSEVDRPFEPAPTPGAAEKAVVAFDA